MRADAGKSWVMSVAKSSTGRTHSIATPGRAQPDHHRSLAVRCSTVLTEIEVDFVNNTPEKAVLDDRPLQLAHKLIFTNLGEGHESQTLLNTGSN